MTDNENVVDFRTREQKRNERIDWVKSKVEAFGGWWHRNKDWAIVVIPAVFGLTKAGVKFANKRINLRKQENLKNLYCYDRSLGHYWALRRELTNAEWLEVDRRRRLGERMADILASMRVLK